MIDFLNVIWSVISTPNADLINFLSIPVLLLIEMPLSFFMLISLFKISYTKKQCFIFIGISSFVAIMGNLFIPSPFNIILNYLSLFILIKLLFKINFIKTCIASLLPSIIFGLIGNLLFNPYLTLLNITFEEATTIPIYRIPFYFVIYSIIFIFVLIIKYKNIAINILDTFDKKNKAIITLNFIFGFFNIIVQGLLTVNYIDILPINFTFFNFICMLIYFGISFFSLAKVINLVTTTQKLESAEEYNKTLHILHDNVRGFKHDFDNIVTTIGGYVKTNDMKGLESYYSQLEEDCQKVNNLYLLNPDIINNHGIYNLLTSKYNKADEKGIKVNLTFLLDLDKLNMKIYEFARILGILLDNAIEASAECEEKIINITFRNDSKNSRNLIIIENTYKDKEINIDNIFNKGISSKENHTGLGLWEVTQILKKNKNVNLHSYKNDKFFIQQLEIYY